MAATDNYLPAMTRKHELIAILDSFVSFRKWCNVFAEHAKHLLVVAKRIIRKPGSLVKTDTFFRCATTVISDKYAAQQILIAGHPEVYAVFVNQPTGATNMVRMKMSDYDMFERLGVHQTSNRLLP